MKVCKKCEIEKEIIQFSRNKNYKDGFENHLLCLNYQSDTFYYYHFYIACIENQKKYYINNKDVVKEKYIEYYYDNKEKAILNGTKYKKNRKKIDIIFRLSSDVRRMICTSFKNKGYTKNSRTAKILGCSYEEFKIYLESKFEPWMTWENKGIYNGELNFGWDIDHIVPLSTAETEKDIIRLNHYTNLQPLCGYTNRYIKKDKI